MKLLFSNDMTKLRGILLLFSLIILLSFIFVDKIFFYNYTKNFILEDASSKIIEKEKQTSSFINNSENVLSNIRESDIFNLYLKTKQKEHRKHLEKLFYIITKNNINFMQLRYIDKNGKEIIRVERNKHNDTPIIKKEINLQDKSSRDYFIDSKTKTSENIWFSNLDLNVENNHIEKPYNPTLRAILPIRTDGQFEGIIIINYFMKEFLEQLSFSSLHKIILIDSEGFIIKHYNKEKDWGKYKKERYNISQEFNDFEKILSTKKLSTKNYVSAKLSSPIKNKPILILQVKDEYIEKVIEENNLQYISIALIVLILVQIAIYFISKVVEVLISDLDIYKNLNQKLNNLNHRLNAILNTTKDSICLLDKDTKIKFVNDSTSKMTKYTKDELLDKEFSSLIDKKHKDDFLNLTKDLINNKEIKNFELTFISKDSELLTLSISLVLMPNNQEILAVARDITSLKEKEDELKSKEQLIMHQSKMAAMGEMLENIAHQWRQPLSMISTNVSGLQVQKEHNILDDTTIDEVFNSILDATQHLSNTIDDFRDFFNQHKKIEKFKISAVLDKTIFLLSSKFNSRDITVETQNTDIEINGYQNQLIQCLMNILSNAKDQLQTLPKEHQRLILIEASKDNESIKIEITDNGGGIDENIINNVFDIYFTTKGKNGTGIGLYMTKVIIEKHLNGQIEVKNKSFMKNNKEYKGATFIITLPTI